MLILQHRLNLYGGNLNVKIIKKYGNLPLVECCAGQLNQVFMNVISNAIDALENQPAPRIITIRTEVMNGEGDENSLSPIAGSKFAVIRISDNGPGMTEPVITAHLTHFFTTKPVGKGTGLGLSISHHIIVEKTRWYSQVYLRTRKGCRVLDSDPAGLGKCDAVNRLSAIKNVKFAKWVMGNG